MWDNSLENPTYEKLDCILISIEWEQKFSLVMVRALQRAVSDHIPLLIDSRVAVHHGNKVNFSIELDWLSREGFYGTVAAKWTRVSRGRSLIKR